MKKYLGWLLCVLPIVSYSQRIEIKEGESHDDEKEIVRLFGEESNAVQALAYHNREYYFEQYETGSYKREFTKPIKLREVDGTRQDLVGIEPVSDGYALITSFYGSKQDKRFVYGHKIDESGNSLFSDKELFTISGNSRTKTGKVYMSVSDNGELITVANAAYDSDQNQTVKIYVFDAGLEEKASYLEESKTKHKGKESRIAAGRFSIDDQGNVYFLRRRYFLEGGLSIGDMLDLDKEWELVRFNEEGKSEVVLDWKKEQIYDLDYTKSTNGAIVLTGFYGGQATGGLIRQHHLKGTFFVSVDQNLKITKKSVDEFPKSLILKHRSKGQYKKEVFLDKTYQIRTMEFTKSGDFIATAEFHELKSDENVLGLPTQYHHYRDLICYRYSPDGELQWVKTILKYQLFSYIGFDDIDMIIQADQELKKRRNMEKNGNYYSYQTVIRDNDLYLIYNDRKGNLEKTYIKKVKFWMHTSGKTSSHVVKIDKNGTVKALPAAEGLGKRQMFCPRVSTRTGDDELIMLVRDKKEQTLSRLVFK